MTDSWDWRSKTQEWRERWGQPEGDPDVSLVEIDKLREAVDRIAPLEEKVMVPVANGRLLMQFPMWERLHFVCFLTVRKGRWHLTNTLRKDVLKRNAMHLNVNVTSETFESAVRKTREMIGIPKGRQVHVATFLYFLLDDH